MNHLLHTYRETLDSTTAQLQAVKKKISIIAYSRFALFLLFCFCWWPVFKYTQYWFILPALLVLALFAVLVNRQVSAEKKKRFLETLTQVIQAELKALEGNFSAFNEGNAFIDFDHPYTFDLDVFGSASLFQHLNRTSSETGRQQLAHWLQHPLLSKEEILLRQEAYGELAQKNVFRQHFLATGLLHPFTEKDKKELSDWMGSSLEKLSFSSLHRLLLILLPVVTIAGWGAWVAGYLHYSIPSLISIINLSWVSSQLGSTNRLHQQLGDKFKMVKNLAHQLQLFEKEKFESGMMKGLQEKLQGHEVSAGKAIHQLGVIMQNFDARLNVFGAFIFNALFLFDLQMTQRLVRWKKQFGSPAAQWLDTIGTIEACNSLGTYVYNHPEFIFPEIADGPVAIEATEMGHPLMKLEKRVNNSFNLSGKGKFVIVTGSNMSGKSTFLRTTGLNVLLAQMGAPVCAQRFRCSPVEIYTSMRINDSLQQNESYFYAEIKRLNKITTEAAKQKHMLILLDEILRGTNSADKHTGSQALMLKLTELNATGILATHDLSLGKLEAEYPGRFINQCFESVIENNELYFDYKIRDGVCKNLNAVFLMKKMGIM